MADSFTELKHAGGSNKPWIAAGVSALAVALIMVALAGAWWSARPAPENTTPATVTVTARPGDKAASKSEIAPPGTYSGTFDGVAVVATFGGSSALVTYPSTQCTFLIDDHLHNRPLTKSCKYTPGKTGTWDVDATVPGLVTLTYREDDEVVVSGTLSLGLPE